MDIKTYFILTRATPNAQLENSTITAVRRSIATNNRNLRILWGLISLLLLVALTPVIITISGQLMQSGMGYYLSIVFSDIGIGSFFTVGTNVGLAILESLPITNLIIVFGLTTLFLLALRKSIQTFSWVSPISKQSASI